MIKLGTVVQDSVTGFSGVVVSRTEYLYGCVRLGIEPMELREGKPVEVQYFDEQRLGASKAKRGGPGSVPPPRKPASP